MDETKRELTPMEERVATLVAQGLPFRCIANQLGKASKTTPWLIAKKPHVAEAIRQKCKRASDQVINSTIEAHDQGLRMLKSLAEDGTQEDSVKASAAKALYLGALKVALCQAQEAADGTGGAYSPAPPTVIEVVPDVD